MVRNLPLVSRNPYNFILFQPNVSGRANTEFGVPRKINANGFNGRINYQIDGSNNTESDRAGIRLIPISDTYVPEIQQVSNGFAPEFGNTVGTVFNTITRSRRQRIPRRRRYIFRRTDFSARPKLLASTGATPEVNVDSYAVDGGGRLIRDKLFFFGAFEHVKRDLPGAGDRPRRDHRATRPAGRLRQRRCLSARACTSTWPRRTGRSTPRTVSPCATCTTPTIRPTTTAPSAGINLISQSYNFVDRSHVGAVQLVSSISTPRMVNELRGQVAYRGQQQDRFAAPAPVRRSRSAAWPTSAGRPGPASSIEETTPEIDRQFQLTSAARTRSSSAAACARIRDTQVQAAARQYTFPTSPLIWLRPTARRRRATPASARSSATRRSITTRSSPASSRRIPGSRPQPDRHLRPALRRVQDAGGRQERRRSLTRRIPHRQEQLRTAPRAWPGRLGKDQKTVMRASTGIFYDPPQTDQYRRALLNNGTPQFFNVSARPRRFAPSFPDVFTSRPAGFTLAPQTSPRSPDFAKLYSINANSRSAARSAPNWR